MPSVALWPWTKLYLHFPSEGQKYLSNKQINKHGKKKLNRIRYIYLYGMCGSDPLHAQYIRNERKQVVISFERTRTHARSHVYASNTRKWDRVEHIEKKCVAKDESCGRCCWLSHSPCCRRFCWCVRAFFCVRVGARMYVCTCTMCVCASAGASEQGKTRGRLSGRKTRS